jgi:hypothetical protein
MEVERRDWQVRPDGINDKDLSVGLGFANGVADLEFIRAR